MKKLILYKGRPIQTHSVTCQECKSSFTFTEDETEGRNNIQCMVCKRGIDPRTGVVIRGFGQRGK